MVHKIEQDGEQKDSDEITMANVTEFYKNVFNEFKPKPKTEEEKQSEAKQVDLDGGHLV